MSKVRVRIAPSPTGTPHVGTAYIALFNYCFAKAKGGSFILRIEDTDQTRSDRLFEEQILKALNWTGLKWDEGPDVGGSFGPYRQSERTEIYREHVQKLLEAEHAYKCFCTPERLEELRKSQMQTGAQGYDGACLKLSPAEIATLEQEKQPYTVRMKVPSEGTCKINDPLRGDIEFDYHTIDHQILLKSDGFPTYHLANVVDDHLMQITDVIRGEEWLPSLPKHILLYEYFGWQAPTVYHLPLLRNADKSKLSKRKNPTSILYYKELGIIPEALVNFLGMMAYSLPDGSEIFDLGTMVESFDIHRISLGGPIFDLDKLIWLNQKHLAQLGEDELLKRLIQWRLNPEFLSKLVPMMTQRLHTLGDFMRFCDHMFVSQFDLDPAELIPKKRDEEGTRELLYKLLWEFEKVPFPTHDDAQTICQNVGDSQGWNMRDTTAALRVAIYGKPLAPPLFHIVEIMGGDMVRNRILAAIQALGPLGKKKVNALQKAYFGASA